MRLQRLLRLPVMLAVALAIAGWLSSCGRREQAAAAPPVMAPKPARPADPVSEPQTDAHLPPPQPVPPEAVPSRPIQAGADRPSSAAQGAEKPNSVEPSPSTPAPPAKPAETAEDSTSQGPSLPRLGQFLDAEQRRDYNLQINENAAQARALLARLPTGELSPDQITEVKRIRTFLQQADDARAQDLEMARSLAARARLLAEDLARSLE